MQREGRKDSAVHQSGREALIRPAFTQAERNFLPASTLVLSATLQMGRTVACGVCTPIAT